MPRIATYKGGPVIDTEGKHPPCYLNKEFFEFEEELESKASSLRGVSGDERPEYIDNMMIEAQRRFCGACPLGPRTGLCLERSLMEKTYTGIAGGKYLVRGVVQ